MSGEQWLPVVTAVVTLLATWFKETTQRRGREQVRQRLLTQVKEEIGITEAWAKAHASLGPSPEPPPVIRGLIKTSGDRSLSAPSYRGSCCATSRSGPGLYGHSGSSTTCLW
jgi:hypothetical protein